jgi:hypothetical protein
MHGFAPAMPLDILSLLLHERVEMDVTKHAKYMKKLHQETQAMIEQQVLTQATRLNKNKREMIFEE